MSILSVMAARSKDDQELLGGINNALLRVQVEAAGKAEALGYTPENVAASRQVLAEFLDIAARVITHAKEEQLVASKTQQASAAENILASFDQQGKSREVWLADLARTSQRFRGTGQIEAPDWDLLEQAVDVLDAELAQDLVALSKA